MGVTISCTKTGRTIDVGSGGFLRLRSKISELVGEPWASHYKALVEERICDEKEREKFYEDFDKKTEELLNKKCVSVKIVDFCLFPRNSPVKNAGSASWRGAGVL